MWMKKIEMDKHELGKLKLKVQGDGRKTQLNGRDQLRGEPFRKRKVRVKKLVWDCIDCCHKDDPSSCLSPLNHVLYYLIFWASY